MSTLDLSENELIEWQETLSEFRKQFRAGHARDAHSAEQQTMKTFAFLLFVMHRSLVIPSGGQSEWSAFLGPQKMWLLKKVCLLSHAVVYEKQPPQALRGLADRCLKFFLKAQKADEELYKGWKAFVTETRKHERAIEASIVSDPTHANRPEALRAELRNNEFSVRAFVFLRREGETQPLWAAMSDEEKRSLLGNDSNEGWIKQIRAAVWRTSRHHDLPWDKVNEGTTDWPLKGNGLSSLGRLGPARRTATLRRAVLREAN